MKSLNMLIRFNLLVLCGSSAAFADAYALNYMALMPSISIDKATTITSQFHDATYLEPSAEPEATSLLSPDASDQNLGSRIDWQEGRDVQYAIFRSSGNVYFKGRAGYLTNEIKEDFEDISIEEIINDFDKNGALGIGAGYILKDGRKLEFEYTITKHSEQIFQIEYLF